MTSFADTGLVEIQARHESAENPMETEKLGENGVGQGRGHESAELECGGLHRPRVTADVRIDMGTEDHGNDKKSAHLEQQKTQFQGARHVSRADEANQDREQNEPEDVVENSCSDNDLSETGIEEAELHENARRCRHGRYRQRHAN